MHQKMKSNQQPILKERKSLIIKPQTTSHSITQSLSRFDELLKNTKYSPLINYNLSIGRC